MTALTALLTGISVFYVAGALLGRPERGPRPRRDSLRVWLVQAGAGVTPPQFILASVGAIGAALLIAWGISGSLVVGLFPALAAGLAPRAYFSGLRRRRLAEVRQAWPDGLRDLAAGVGSGLSLAQAISALARDGPAPLRTAFASFDLISRVHGVVPALVAIRDDLADPASDRIIEVLVVAHERGGPLTRQLLVDLADATTRDLWTAEMIRTDQLEQKINARAVFALPWLVLLFLTATVPEYRAFYGSTQLGTTVVVVGAVFSGAGLWLASRLGRDEEEPRILGGAT